MFKYEVSHVTERTGYPETLAIKKTAHIKHNQERRQFMERAAQLTECFSACSEDQLAGLMLPNFYKRYSEETLRAVLGEKFEALRRLSLTASTQETNPHEQDENSDAVLQKLFLAEQQRSIDELSSFDGGWPPMPAVQGVHSSQPGGDMPPKLARKVAGAHKEMEQIFAQARQLYGLPPEPLLFPPGVSMPFPGNGSLPPRNPGPQSTYTSSYVPYGSSSSLADYQRKLNEINNSGRTVGPNGEPLAPLQQGTSRPVHQGSGMRASGVRSTVPAKRKAETDVVDLTDL